MRSLSILLTAIVFAFLAVTLPKSASAQEVPAITAKSSHDIKNYGHVNVDIQAKFVNEKLYGYRLDPKKRESVLVHVTVTVGKENDGAFSVSMSTYSDGRTYLNDALPAAHKTQVDWGSIESWRKDFNEGPWQFPDPKSISIYRNGKLYVADAKNLEGLYSYYGILLPKDGIYTLEFEITPLRQTK